MMQTKQVRETGKVLQFPWQSIQSAVRQARLLTDVRPVRLPRIAPVNCWYHDAAIEEERTRKH